MKKLFSVIALAALQLTAAAQTTVTFKPAPGLGDNTGIMTTYGCQPAGWPSLPENTNAGTVSEMLYADWTYNAAGCSHGTSRSLIRFNQLSTIPSGATIMSATLRLFGVPTSTNFGNSTYPGSPYPLSNDGFVNEVTSPWSIGSVTWNTQPGIGGSPVAIPPSTARFGWNTAVNVTSMVQNMVSGPNYGFMTTLQTEAIYREVIFAGNGNSDPRLWPELTVTYCDPSFTYCVDGNNPYTVLLNANTVVAGNTYQWVVNGAVVGSGPTFSYAFPGPGSFKVCLRLFARDGQPLCERCMAICLDDNGRPRDPQSADPSQRGSSNVIHGSFPKGDLPALKTGMIAPNPTHDGWNIAIDHAGKDGKAEITVYDMNGKVVSRQSRTLTEGSNVVYQSAASLAPGTYTIEYTDGKNSRKEKAVKE